MRRILLGCLLIFAAIVGISCREFDPSGLVNSSDVDNRFRESALLPEKANIDINTADFSFIVLADPHVYKASHSKLAVLKDRILPGDQFILVCGDLSQCGYEEDYNALALYLDGAGLPYYTAIGNHDLYFNGWQNYKETFGKSSYSFTAGQARVICIDSANGTLGRKQKNWLEQTLKDKNETLCFAFTHFEFFNRDPGSLQQYTDIEEIYYMMDLFEKSKVKYVFMGHCHDYYHKVVNGVNYLNIPDFVDESGDKYYIRVFVNGADISHEKLKL